MRREPTFVEVRRAGGWQQAQDSVTLPYEGRLIRRRRLTTDGGASILVDLLKVTSLAPGDALADEAGRVVEVRAADEALLEVRGDLPRLAWHIGNRHAPCQIEGDRLLVAEDHVLADLLRRLGADLRPVSRAFHPEGGAYAEAHTFGHDPVHEDAHGPGVA